MVVNGFVSTQIERGIGTVEFGHPMSNSLPNSILNQLADAILDLDQNSKVKVLVLKSAGEKTFCAGASFEELSAIKNEAQGLSFFSGFAKVINACRTSSKLIIGRVQGKAVGGGVGIAAAVDYCMALETADVKLSELAVGIGPFVVGPAVERKVGLSAMSELAINATAWRSASWAKEKGLYTQTFQNLTDLDQAVEELALRLSNSNPEAMSALKRVFWEGTEHWDQLLVERAKISGQLVLSDFSKNAIAQFKAK